MDRGPQAFAIFCPSWANWLLTSASWGKRAAELAVLVPITIYISIYVCIYVHTVLNFKLYLNIVLQTILYIYIYTHTHIYIYMLNIIDRHVSKGPGILVFSLSFHTCGSHPSSPVPNESTNPTPEGSLLHLAAMRGHQDMVQMLVHQRGADIDPWPTKTSTSQVD